MVIRERLLNEIPAEEFLKMGDVVFAAVHKYYANLQAGDPPLDQIAFFLFAKEISQTQENKMVREI